MQDGQYIAEVANFIWNDGLRPDQVTPAVADVVAQAFHSAVKKSKALDYVPRPTMNPTATWLVSQAVQMFWRTKSRKVYEIARRAAALQYRSMYEMAKMGI